MTRRRWHDAHVAAYIDELRTFGLEAAPAHVAELIDAQVAHVALGMGFTKQTARGYVTGESTRLLARETAASIVEEQPGAAVLDLPRTLHVAASELARASAALAMAGRIFMANADYAAGDQCLVLLFAAARMIADATPGSVGVPQALLSRLHRRLTTAADVLDAGGQLPDPIDDPASTLRHDVARQLRTDAAHVRHELDAQ